MLLSFAYLTFSALLRLLVSGRRSSEFAKDVELLVPRHQQGVGGLDSGGERDVAGVETACNLYFEWEARSIAWSI